MTSLANQVIYVLPPVLGTCLAALFCLALTRTIRVEWVFAAAFYFALDVVVVVDTPPIPGAHWNWSGKAAALLLAIIAALLFRLSSREIGLILPKSGLSRTWSIIGVAGAVLFDGGLNYLLRDHHKATYEALLYQATMPGMSEEVAYRGIGFALIQRAFPSQNDRRAGMPSVIVTSFVFALGHGYSRDNGSGHFVWIPFVFTLVLGLWFAWVRARSGSLIGPVLAHNTGNVAGTWLAGLR